MCESSCYDCEYGLEVSMYTRENGELEYFNEFSLVWCKVYLLNMVNISLDLFEPMAKNCEQYIKM